MVRLFDDKMLKRIFWPKAERGGGGGWEKKLHAERLYNSCLSPIDTRIIK